jgi:hypothetical protein
MVLGKNWGRAFVEDLLGDYFKPEILGFHNFREKVLSIWFWIMRGFSPG